MMTSILWTLVLAAQGGDVAVALSEQPVAGRTCVLVCTREGKPAADLKVNALYRKNAHQGLVRQRVIGSTGPDGKLEWTPRRAGVVELSWEGGAKNVSVLHREVPVSGVFVIIVAGLLLIGGMIVFFVRMLMEPEASPDEDDYSPDSDGSGHGAD